MKLKHFAVRLIALALFAAIALSSCSAQKTQSRLQEKLKIEAIEDISGSIGSGWVITIRVRNDSSFSPALTRGEGDIYVDGVKTAYVMLMSPVELPKRQTSSIEIPLSITIHSPLKALSLLMRLSQRNFDDIDIAFRASIKAVGAERNIVVERVGLNAILNQFGYK